MESDETSYFLQPNTYCPEGGVCYNEKELKLVKKWYESCGIVTSETLGKYPSLCMRASMEEWRCPTSKSFNCAIVF